MFPLRGASFVSFWMHFLDTEIVCFLKVGRFFVVKIQKELRVADGDPTFSREGLNCNAYSVPSNCNGPWKMSCLPSFFHRTQLWMRLSTQIYLMVFHWNLSDSKSPQVSRTLLSILAVFNNVIVWMVSTCPPTSNSSSPFSNPLVTVPNAPITIGIIVTCLFHCFFNSLSRSGYLSFFSHSFSFILWSASTAKSTILQVL